VLISGMSPSGDRVSRNILSPAMRWHCDAHVKNDGDRPELKMVDQRYEIIQPW